MIDKLGLLIYLDDVLVRSINSIQGNFYGYIDVKTRKKIWDVGVTARNHKQNQNTLSLEDRKNKDKKEGFKGYSKSDITSETNTGVCDSSQEHRGGTRCEEEVKEIYTSYVYHMEFCNNLLSNGNLKEYCTGTYCENGDYILLKGTLIENNVLSYIDAILLIINSYGEEILDKLISEDEILKTKNIRKILEKIQFDLQNDGTLDILVRSQCDKYILQTNKKCFFNTSSCISTNVGCDVNVIAKLVKKVDRTEQVSLLRKLNQTEFYESLIERISRIFNKIDIGVPMPKLGSLKIESTLQIIPMSIFI